MKLPSIDYQFILLTPAMLGGAEGKNAPAEMRAASIRGQVRWWHRKCGLAPGCNDVWGMTEPSTLASRVSLTLQPSPPPARVPADILPHDLRKSGAPRDAIAPDQIFTLTLRRLIGCGNDHWAAAQKAVKLWLLLGGLGLRVNRAAGSVWPEDSWAPGNEAELRELLNALGYRAPVQLAGSSLGASPEALRKAASDTVSVPRFFGSITPRRPSPLRMKVVRLSGTRRLLLTGLNDAEMSQAKTALGDKQLGRASWTPV